MEGIKVDGTFDNVVQAAIKMDNQQEEMHESMKLKEYGEPKTPIEKIVNFIWRWRWQDISEAYEINDDPSDGVKVIEQGLEEVGEREKYSDEEINSANDQLFKRWVDYNSDSGWRPYEESVENEHNFNEIYESTMREGSTYQAVADHIWNNYGPELMKYEPSGVYDCRNFVKSHIDHSQISNKDAVDGICLGAASLLMKRINPEYDARKEIFGESTLSHERNFEAENFKEAYNLREEGYNTLVNRAGEVERFKDPNKPDTTHYDYQEVFSPCHWGDKIKNALDAQLKAIGCELESEKGIRAATRVYNYYQETVADLKHDGDWNGSNELRNELEKLRVLILKTKKRNETRRA